MNYRIKQSFFFIPIKEEIHLTKKKKKFIHKKFFFFFFFFFLRIISNVTVIGLTVKFTYINFLKNYKALNK